jgi:WD40 repeat protein
MLCYSTIQCHENFIWQLKFSNREDQLITSGMDSHVKVWKVTKRSLLFEDN